MSKPRKQTEGFSDVSKHLGLKDNQNLIDQSDLEKKALLLLNSGKFIEAENLYRDLISNGSNNHIVFGNFAALCGMRGNKTEMVKFLKLALTIEPKYADAHNNLGVVFKEEGDLNAAIESFYTAIEMKPNLADAHMNLGNALKEKGDLNGAIKSFYKVIEIRPKYAEVYNNLGNCLREQGDIKGAKESFRDALKIKPNYAEVYNNLGNCLREQGDIKGAKESFSDALKIRPKFAEAYNNLGNCLREEGDILGAISCYQESIIINPKCSEAFNNLGHSYQKTGEIKAAIESFSQAIMINSNFIDAHNNLGNSLLEDGDLNSAIKCFHAALEIDSTFAEAHNNLGIILNKRHDFSAAIKSFNKALKYKPNFSKACFNLANTLHEIGDFQSALSYFYKALEIKPDYAEAHLNLSITQLLLGDYKSGWDNYEWRWKCKVSKQPHAKPQIPKWDWSGKSLGEKILLVSEQGLGDTMQFMRFIPCLRQEGFDVTFCAQSKLHSLIRTSGLHSNPITPEIANTTLEGKWLPLLSLPKFLGINPTNPVITPPYIFSKIELIQKWKKIFQSENKPIIGINWQGNPNTEKDLLIGRSLSLEEFAGIANIESYKLLSLQKGFGSEQLKSCSFRDSFVNCQNEVESIWDFLEISAIILNCDLIITSDTSVAHLAGGLGKKTWLLLKNIPEWRWGLKGEKTFWYPSMRLFRQNEKNNWHELMTRVKLELMKENGKTI